MAIIKIDDTQKEVLSEALKILEDGLNSVEPSGGSKCAISLKGLDGVQDDKMVSDFFNSAAKEALRKVLGNPKDDSEKKGSIVACYLLADGYGAPNEVQITLFNVSVCGEKVKEASEMRGLMQSVLKEMEGIVESKQVTKHC